MVDDVNEDQQQQHQTEQVDPPVDLFELGADALNRLDYPTERVQEVRDSFRYQDAFTSRRLKLIGDADPELAEKIDAAIDEEKSSEAADKVREEEVAQLDQLEAQQRADAMAALRDEAAAVAHEEEIDTFLVEGGIVKARELADVFASKESSPAEALSAWDAASAAEREVATSMFGTAPIDFDIDEVLGRGGAS
jgi:hypothetical protein